MVVHTETVTYTEVPDMVTSTIMKNVTMIKFPTGITVQSSIYDLMTSSWCASKSITTRLNPFIDALSSDTPTIAPTVTVTYVSSTSTGNLETTNKTLIITTSSYNNNNNAYHTKFNFTINRCSWRSLLNCIFHFRLSLSILCLKEKKTK